MIISGAMRGPSCHLTGCVYWTRDEVGSPVKRWKAIVKFSDGRWFEIILDDEGEMIEKAFDLEAMARARCYPDDASLLVTSEEPSAT